MEEQTPPADTPPSSGVPFGLQDLPSAGRHAPTDLSSLGPDDVYIETVDDAERLCARPTRIDGSLWIECADCVDLLSLSCIDSVGQDLVIIRNPVLESLLGLERLSSVGGSIYLSLNPVLNSVSGLRGLRRFGTRAWFTLSIGGNAALTSLDGLGAPAALESSVVLAIWDNATLESLEGLAIEESAGYLPFLVEIDGNPALQSLSGLSALSDRATNLFVLDNDALLDLGGLEDIEFNPDGLDWDPTSAGVVIVGNDALLSLDGLNLRSDIGHAPISIRDNPALLEIDALSSLEDSGGGIGIINNDSLEDLDGLANVVTLGNTFGDPDSLSIIGNDALVRIDGVNQLDGTGGVHGSSDTGCVSIGSLVIQENGRLEEISGLNAYRETCTRISIHANPSLVTLGGFDRLGVAHEVTITDNTSLSTADAQAFADGHGGGTVSGNGP